MAKGRAAVKFFSKLGGLSDDSIKGVNAALNKLGKQEGNNITNAINTLMGGSGGLDNAERKLMQSIKSAGLGDDITKQITGEIGHARATAQAPKTAAKKARRAAYRNGPELVTESSGQMSLFAGLETSSASNTVEDAVEAVADNGVKGQTSLFVDSQGNLTDIESKKRQIAQRIEDSRFNRNEERLAAQDRMKNGATYEKDGNTYTNKGTEQVEAEKKAAIEQKKEEIRQRMEESRTNRERERIDAEERAKKGFTYTDKNGNTYTNKGSDQIAAEKRAERYEKYKREKENRLETQRLAEEDQARNQNSNRGKYKSEAEYENAQANMVGDSGLTKDEWIKRIQDEYAYTANAEGYSSVDEAISKGLGISAINPDRALAQGQRMDKLLNDSAGFTGRMKTRILQGGRDARNAISGFMDEHLPGARTRQARRALEPNATITGGRGPSGGVGGGAGRTATGGGVAGAEDVAEEVASGASFLDYAGEALNWAAQDTPHAIAAAGIAFAGVSLVGNVLDND